MGPCAGGRVPGVESAHSPSAQRCRGCRASRGGCTAGPPGGWSTLLAAWALNSRKRARVTQACLWPLAHPGPCFSVEQAPHVWRKLAFWLAGPTEGPPLASEALSSHPEIPETCVGSEPAPLLGVRHSSSAHACLLHLLLPTGEQRAYAAKTLDSPEGASVSNPSHLPPGAALLLGPQVTDGLAPLTPSPSVSSHEHGSRGRQPPWKKMHHHIVQKKRQSWR